MIHEARTDLPIAVAVKDDDEPIPGQVTNISNETTGDEATIPSGSGCFYLEGLIGCSLTLTAVVATFAIELAAAICYCLAAGFYHVAKIDACPILIKAIFMLVVHALMLADAILLTVSLILTEVLGLVTGITTAIWTALTRCVSVGKAWHAYVRKVCHLTRWAFRDFHHGWALKRKFSMLDVGVDEHDSAEASVEAIAKPVPVVVSHTSANRSSNHDRSSSDELRKFKEYQV